jgi:hypothetical protein
VVGAFRAVGTFATAGATSVDVPYPAGVVAGDLLLIQYAGNAASAPNTPAGWTKLLGPVAYSGGSGYSGYIFYKIAGASEPGILTITSPSVMRHDAIMSAWLSIANSPIDVSATATLATSGTNAVAPTVTTVKNDVRVLRLYWTWTNSSNTLTPNASDTERYDTYEGNLNTTFELGDRAQAAAGSSGTSTAVTSQALIGGLAATIGLSPLVFAIPDKIGKLAGRALVPYGITAPVTRGKQSGPVNNDWELVGPAAGVTLYRPRSVVQGRLMIAIIRTRNTSPTITPPSGWTLFDGPRTYGNANRNTVWTYWKIAGSSEPVSYTWVLSAGVVADFGAIHTFSVNDQITPINASAFAVSTSLTPPQVTTTVPNTQLLSIIMTDEGDTATRTTLPPSGESEVYSRHDVASSLFLEAGRMSLGSAGATSLGAYTTGALAFSAFKATIAVAPVTTPVGLLLTPSGADSFPTSVDTGTLGLKLAASSAETISRSDVGTATLAFTPSFSNLRIVTDSGAVGVLFAPSASEVFLHNTEFGTLPLKFDFSSVVSYAPGDFATVLETLTVTYVEAAQVVLDSGAIYLHLTEQYVEHYCVYSSNFEGYSYNRWTANLRARWFSDLQNRWIGTLVEGGEPNPC